MTAYILRRLLLMVPTLLGILLLNFLIIRLSPGSPVDQIIAQLRQTGSEATARISGRTGSEVGGSAQPGAPGAAGGGGVRIQGMDPQVIEKLMVQMGMSAEERELWRMSRAKPESTDWKSRLATFGRRMRMEMRLFVRTLVSYLKFDFGTSFFHDKPVVRLILERMPVSISLGLWSTLIIYFVSIPLGIRKAVRDGSRFDVWTSGLVVLGNAIPGFIFAILLVVVFAGGRYLDWFPLRGLVSENWGDLAWPMKILDYLWHMALPVTAMTIGGFATLTMLTKNSFLDQIHQQYVMTAYAKGLNERQVLYGHVFRNAMLIVIAGFPAVFIGMLFTGSVLIEVIFNLDGIGLLGFEAAVKRNYPVMFGDLYIFALMGLVLKLVSDLMYTWIDPRIDFESQ